MEAEKNSVISDIRACLISTKGAVPLGQLQRDYKTIIGCSIPYGKFGFRKLQDFLESEKSFFLSTKNGEVFVDARKNEKSAHIVQLIGHQKSARRKRPRRSRRRQFISKPVTTTNWRPKFSTRPKESYPRSSRVEALCQNQFVDLVSSVKNAPSITSVVPQSSNSNNPKILARKISNDAKSYINPVLIENEIINKQVQKLKLDVNNETSSESCTSLVNTNKRIFQRLSKTNNNPVHKTTEDVSVPLTELNEFIPKGDPITDLENFVKYINIGPVEVSTRQVGSKRNIFFICMIKIGKLRYTTYPKEFKTAQNAEKHAAEEALRELLPKHAKEKSLLTAGTKDILERIPPMLRKHHYGMWAWQLELDFIDKYNEKLPDDWLKTVDSSPNIQLEKCLENYIIRYSKSDVISKSSPKRNIFLALSDVSVPLNTVQFGNENKLYAEVSCVMSANEIWCTQCCTEENDNFCDMIVRMEQFYYLHEKDLRNEIINIDSYYVAKYDNTWYRIRAIRECNGEVLCFFIDCGDEVMIPKDKIYRLRREFAQCQAQAFVCRLVGLEDLYEATQFSEILQKILYQQVILELERDIKDSDDITLPVYMYSIESGNSINEEMIPLLTQETASPYFQKDVVLDVFISNIESNGDIYVQYRSHWYENFQNLLVNLEKQILNNPPTDLVKLVTKDNSKNKIYLLQSKLDGHFYRVQIIDWAPNEEFAQVYYVDLGAAEVIKIKHEILYPLDKLNDILNQYPFQAKKVNMAIDQIPDDFVNLVKRALSEDQMVLMKIIDQNDDCPRAEFFKRNLDEGLFCINKSIAMEAELKQRAKNKKRTAFGKISEIKFSN